ncbi:hypothetical protein CL176_01615 [Suicoccus acidiformans]|uniref:Uncharacterized protein n=1 Tax=Suicoccus acidiformans TaxID=2036206 RepID=A0A347WIB0_9LACT|nr:hypothetical protein [Suicoccus acidiformans]AXY24817.1 hypothetical protein CL176_01615 [Suicoccus acidiformans]
MERQKEAFRGIVEKAKLIQAEEPVLAYAKIRVDSDQSLHCLIAKKPLTFLYEVQADDEISVYGHFNQQKQFVVERYLSSSKYAQAPDYPAHLEYPHKKD